MLVAAKSATKQQKNAHLQRQEKNIYSDTTIVGYIKGFLNRFLDIGCSSTQRKDKLHVKPLV